MSTIEKILLSLQENCNGKKDKLTNSYQERSVWLRNEFDVIRNLIKQNPREHMANQKEPELASVEPTASSSSSVSREQSGDGRKRKSPETVNAVKLSPQQKRSSIDVDDLVSQAGLPSDLNKLKKEQLLVELGKRGNTHFSMRDTKNVLIDGLRDTLLSEHQSRDEAPEQPILQNAYVDQKESGDSTDCSSAQSGSSSAAANESESTSMVLSTPSKPASVRKGSIMADLRSLVQNNNAQAGSAAINGASEGTSTITSSKRIEDEYQARMNRQRESIAARKSVLGEAQVALTAAAVAAVPASTAAPMPEPPAVSAAVLPPPTAAPVKEVAAAAVAAPAPVLSLAVPQPVKAGDAKDSIGSTASAASGDNIWMEVSSPVRTSSAPAAQEEEEKSAPIAASDSHMRPRTESDASFQSCASTGSSISKASTSSKSGTTTGSSTTSIASVRPISSKVSYNTEKPAVAKSVAPTLMKAKLGLKPIDEPRTAAPSAVLKKKDPIPENKPLGSKPVTASASSAAAASAQPARPVNAAPAPGQAAPTTAAASTSAVAVSADTAATANAAPVKKSIFGFLSNSKKNITTTSAAPVAPSALSSSGGSSLFSPSAQSSARSAAPAMVDSIIKSAKMDSAPVAAPTPVAAPIQKASPSEQPSDASKGPLGGSGGKIAGTPGAPLNNAFASKSLISNIVNNYNNAVKSTPAPVVASTPAAVKPAAAPSVAAAASAGNSVLRDITPAAGNAPASAVKAAPAAAVPATPSAVASVASAAAVNEYIIEDRDDSDEEGEGSGTDGEKEDGEEKKPKQNVPDWARGPLLKEALERQYGMGGQVPVDPDLIFPEVTTCSLEEIFGAREGLSRKYANRSSSAHWDADQMTLVEKRVYRKHMGYDRGQQQQQTGATPLGSK